MFELYCIVIRKEFNQLQQLHSVIAQQPGPVFIDPQYGDSEEDEVVDYEEKGQSSVLSW